MATTIAIIDDDGGVRTALKELLRVIGFDALTFASAEEFLASRSRHQVNCIVADVHLPGMTGAALLRKLASLGASVPAVLITAHDDPATLELIRETGPVPNLRKPFNDEDLSCAIQRAIAA